MLSKYFEDFTKNLKPKKTAAKKTAAKGAKKGTDAKSAGKKTAGARVDKKKIIESIDKIIPQPLIAGDVKTIDSSGFSPDGADFIVYKDYCKDLDKIMGGYIPCEFVYGAYFIVQKLDKKSLVDVMKKVMVFKKLNSFSETGEEPFMVPAFIIALDSDYEFIELKSDIINYYISENIVPQYEIDIINILGKGIVLKNWREQRSFIALETGEDTSMWFFILMNEYLDNNDGRSYDLRNYVKKDVVYKEY